MRCISWPEPVARARAARRWPWCSSMRLSRIWSAVTCPPRGIVVWPSWAWAFVQKRSSISSIVPRYELERGSCASGGSGSGSRFSNRPGLGTLRPEFAGNRGAQKASKAGPSLEEGHAASAGVIGTSPLSPETREFAPLSGLATTPNSRCPAWRTQGRRCEPRAHVPMRP